MINAAVALLPDLYRRAESMAHSALNVGKVTVLTDAETHAIINALEALSGVPSEVLKAHDDVFGDPRVTWLAPDEALKEGLELLPELELKLRESRMRPEADHLYTIISVIRALASAHGDEGIVEALRSLLAYEQARAKKQGFSDCTCMGHSHEMEIAYETGNCPHQKARAALEVVVPQGHTNPTGERLSAPDLAHRFVDETYGYEPQDPMARYLRERFTEYIEIDRAMAAAPLASAHAGDELIERVALALFHDDKPFAKASNLIPTSEELEPWRSSARAAINAIIGGK